MHMHMYVQKHMHMHIQKHMHIHMHKPHYVTASNFVPPQRYMRSNMNKVGLIIYDEIN